MRRFVVGHDPRLTSAGQVDQFKQPRHLLQRSSARCWRHCLGCIRCEVPLAWRERFAFLLLPLLASVAVDHQQVLHDLSVTIVATGFDLLGRWCWQAKVALDAATLKLPALVCC